MRLWSRGLGALSIAGLLAVVSVAVATAQNARGIVTGRASDKSGGALQGARVDLRPGGASVVTNVQGMFTITDVSPGNYQVTVSFSGFAAGRSEVTVTGGQTATVNVQLDVATQSEQLLVTAARPHGEAEAINREESAENILQVLPHDVITSLPNANVADAIGRLPSVTLERDEGEGKYVQIRGAEPATAT